MFRRRLRLRSTIRPLRGVLDTRTVRVRGPRRTPRGRGGKPCMLLGPPRMDSRPPIDTRAFCIEQRARSPAGLRNCRTRGWADGPRRGCMGRFAMRSSHRSAAPPPQAPDVGGPAPTARAGQGGTNRGGRHADCSQREHAGALRPGRGRSLLGGGTRDSVTYGSENHPAALLSMLGPSLERILAFLIAFMSKQ
jgi:hypothetical protein